MVVLSLEKRTSHLQQELWSGAAPLARKDPRSIPASLFLTALNDVIDFSEKQTIAFHNYIPTSIIGLLFFVALIAMGATGYLRGLNTGRHWGFTSLLALLIAMTLFVILDLDRSRSGLIRTKYKSMLRLQDTVQQAPVSP